jgi:diguanylate cyclase
MSSKLERQGVKAFARARNLSGRLTRAAMESISLGLFVAGAVINILIVTWSLSDLRSEAQVHAGIAADNAAAALVFNDTKAASETLSFLKGLPEVVRADLYDDKGQIFATYAIPEDAKVSLPFVPTSWRSLSADEPVTHETRRVGHIHLTISTWELFANVAWMAGFTLLSVVLGMWVAHLRMKRVRKAVSWAEKELDQLAFFDQVTGLYNRHAAKEFLDEAVQAEVKGFTVALLDLDDFKLVNDTLGHKAGDELLRSLANRLRQVCGSHGTVFRLGGDEFIIAWDALHSAQDAAVQGRAIVQALVEPLEVSGQMMFVRASVGLAQFPAHGLSAQELLRAADTAMYQAKSAGKNTYALFDTQMAQKTADQLKLCNELALALERNELVLHYQPIVDLATRMLVGVEALVRWQHPTRGLLSAIHFIDAAEESGLVIQLGGWVVHEAAAQQVRWREQGLGHLFIAVNASAQQFKRNVLLDQVTAAINQTGANPTRLQIELTEHTLVEDVDSNVQTLSALQARGIKVAIDDFGTGLSSLAYLKRLPIDKLKIDRSFVDDLGTGQEDTAIVTAIVSLAHALSLEVVAEGIETPLQLDHLHHLGVEHGQGYLFSKPVPAADISTLAEQQWHVGLAAVSSRRVA